MLTEHANSIYNVFNIYIKQKLKGGFNLFEKKMTLLVISCLLLIVLSICTVSASENILSDDNQTVSIEEDFKENPSSEVKISDYSHESTSSSIQEDIISEPDNGTVEALQNDYTYHPDYSYYDNDYYIIDISKPLTIDGNNHSIYKIAINCNSPVILKNIQFNNSQIDHYYHSPYLNVQVINCNFINFKCNEGRYLIDVYGNISIISCNFINCHGSDYELINIEENSSIISCNFTNCSGSPILDISGGNIINSTFTNSQIEYSGNLIYNNGGNLYINNCKFTHIDCSNDGGIIYTTENTTIINSIFNDNYGMEGGVIYNYRGNLYIDNCNFTHNEGSTCGVLYNTGENTTITNSIFNDNYAMEGGVIYNYRGNLYIGNCNFTHNIANDGGVIYTFDKYYDFVLGNAHKINITKSRFFNNTARIGGAISNYDSYLYIDNTVFNTNPAKLSSAIYGDANLNNCSFIESENTNSTENGEFINVTDAYTYLNTFRTENGVWYWNEDDTTKTIFNTNESNQLTPLIRDEKLEETAKIRAQEIVQSFSHTRPNNSTCFTAFPSDLMAYGENIAYGQSSCY